jgi:hypothetical protein
MDPAELSKESYLGPRDSRRRVSLGGAGDEQLPPYFLEIFFLGPFYKSWGRLQARSALGGASLLPLPKVRYSPSLSSPSYCRSQFLSHSFSIFIPL